MTKSVCRWSQPASVADVKVTIVGGALNGLTAGFLIKVEELTPDLASVRLFHTSVTRQRHLARLAG